MVGVDKMSFLGFPWLPEDGNAVASLTRSGLQKVCEIGRVAPVSPMTGAVAGSIHMSGTSRPAYYDAIPFCTTLNLFYLEFFFCLLKLGERKVGERVRGQRWAARPNQPGLGRAG